MESEKEQENSPHSESSPNHIETNYEENKANPGPPIEAIEEENKNGAGKMLKFVIPILVIILFIAWLLIKE